MLLLTCSRQAPRADRDPRRIDGLMALALSYMLWFVGIPFAHALARL